MTEKKYQVIIVGAPLKGRLAEFIKHKESEGIITYKVPQEPPDPLAFLSKSLLVKDELPHVRMAHMVKLGNLSGRKNAKKGKKRKKRKKR